MLVVLFSVDVKQPLFVDGIYECWCLTVYEGGYCMSDDMNCIKTELQSIICVHG